MYRHNAWLDMVDWRKLIQSIPFFADTPKNTLLTANDTSNETCLGWIVKFTCIADANPAVNKYYLYEDDIIVDMDVSGVWIRPLNKSGHVIYRCEANNSLGSGISNTITLTVGGKFMCNVLCWARER